MTGRSTTSRTHAHVVHFYDRSNDLIEAVGRYIAEPISTSGSAVVIATPAHRAGLDEWLDRQDLDWESARNEGRYVALDAAETMDRFMVKDRPDAALFRAVLSPILGASVSPVFAFGEMVSLLWEQGNVLGAVELELLWNELAEQCSFTLYCAYRAAAFANSDDLNAVGAVCAAHSNVIPPTSYALTELPVVVPAAQAQMFLPVPEAILGVRRFVAGALAMNHSRPFISDALLVASELATNAVRHAQGPFRAIVTPSDDAVRLEFHDASPSSPRLRLALTTEVDGRGLAIVERLARAWGVEERATGKIVWADVAYNLGAARPTT